LLFFVFFVSSWSSAADLTFKKCPDISLTSDFGGVFGMALYGGIHTNVRAEAAMGGRKKDEK
jgi:hypothetical protein